MSNETIARDLGWTPTETFESGMRKTVQWYLDNTAWVADLAGREREMAVNQKMR